LIDLALFLQLATVCAPRVAPETLAAVARTESRFNELSINDNTTRQAIATANRDEAVAAATKAIAQRHSVDLGLMQVNSGNLSSLGLSVADAFDPCRSLAAAETLLVQGYAPGSQAPDQQTALLRTLSRYNTGDPAKGFANGYVARVQASAEIVVPAIRLRGEALRPEPIPAPAQQAGTAAAPAPPSWDVYRQAQARAGSALVFGSVPARPAPTSTPVQLRASPNQQASLDAR
jgi:type IV secretion system protein VirB1